jgi:hypothetical protein
MHFYPSVYSQFSPIVLYEYQKLISQNTKIRINYVNYLDLVSRVYRFNLPTIFVLVSQIHLRPGIHRHAIFYLMQH